MPRATLKSIAKATGFSVTTVSRALGGHSDVNEDTRYIIEQEALSQGYTPNLQARLLQGQRSQTIGLIMPDTGPRFTDPFFNELLSGIGSRAAESGFDVLLSTSDHKHDEIEAYRHMVAGRRVDGLVLARTHHDDQRIHYLLTTEMPFVVFGRTDSQHDYVYIDVDGVAGQRSLTEHFIALGHRHIAYIAPPQHLMFARYRMQGFREAMAAHQLAVFPELVIEAHLSEHAGYAAAGRLLDLPQSPTAIMAGDDAIAFGVMRAVQARGLRVGVDVAVGGFDDVPLAAHVVPGLTTIHHPIYEIGQQLTGLLLKMIDGQELDQKAVLVKPDLIVRGSSGV